MASDDGGVMAVADLGEVPEGRVKILRELLRERAAQEAELGAEDYPDVNPHAASHGASGGRAAVRWVSEQLGLPTADVAAARREDAQAIGSVSWLHRLVESVSAACEAATLAQQGLGPQAEVDRRLLGLMAAAMGLLESRARRGAGSALRCFSNGTDYVSAVDFDDAVAVLREVYGDDLAPARKLAPVPDELELCVAMDVPEPTPQTPCVACRAVTAPSGRSGRNAHLIGCAVGAPRKRASEWAAEGRGLIFSTEA